MQHFPHFQKTKKAIKAHISMKHPNKPSNFSLVDPSAKLQSPQKDKPSTPTAIHRTEERVAAGSKLGVQSSGGEGGDDETPFMTEGADEMAIDTSLMSGLDDDTEVSIHRPNILLFNRLQFEKGALLLDVSLLRGNPNHFRLTEICTWEFNRNDFFPIHRDVFIRFHFKSRVLTIKVYCQLLKKRCTDRAVKGLTY